MPHELARFASAAPSFDPVPHTVATGQAWSAPHCVASPCIIAEDPSSHALMGELERLAPSEAAILIIGETGTGKELIARHVHTLSARRHGPFVPVNCGALVDTLIEAELFGYEKGAYTGAFRTQIGWFEAANGGTLLLDEIGDLPLQLQVKLLRVLQDRAVTRLGSRVAVPVDIRVLAATNADLRGAVADGRFREDLYFRLNVARLEVPPLRARPGDVAPLARHYLAVHADQLDRSELALSEPALAALRSHAWPGNIRELENVIYNAALLAPGPFIEPADLKLDHVGRASSGGADRLEDELMPLLERALEERETALFDRVTRLLLCAGLSHSEGNQVRAAARLGISRSALRTQLAHIGLAPARRRRGRAPDGGGVTC